MTTFEPQDDTAKVTEWTLSAPFFGNNGRQRKLVLTKAPEPVEGYIEENTWNIAELESMTQLGEIVAEDKKENSYLRFDNWRIGPKGNKRLAEQEKAGLPLFEKPFELQSAWTNQELIEKEEPFKFWADINEEELLGGSFWTKIATEIVSQNAEYEQKNYERENSHDVDWLMDLLDKGMHEIQKWTQELSLDQITPQKLVEVMKLAKTEDDQRQQFSSSQNGWFILQNDNRTAWTQKEPGNRMTWLTDILGNWKKDAEGPAENTPLSRMLSTLALALTYNQLQKDILTSRESFGEVQAAVVGMQWQVNIARMSSRRFLKNWVQKTLTSLEEPEETTRIDIIGKGEKHVLIWIADKIAPRIWLWNYGSKSGRKHQQELQRLAKDEKLQFEEIDAIEKLAAAEWSESNVEECIKAFTNDRNFVGDNIIAIGQNRSDTLNKKLLQAIEGAIAEVKNQKPGREAPLRLILVNLTGGWKWPTGARFCPNSIVHRVLETWRTCRKQLGGQSSSRLDRLGRRISIEITSENWESHFEMLTEQMKAVAEGDADPKLWPERLFAVENFSSVSSGWETTLITTGDEMNAVWNFKEEIKAIREQVNSREEVQNIAARGISLYKTAEKKLTAAYIGPAKTEKHDLVRLTAAKINEEEIEHVSEAAEIFNMTANEQQYSLTIMVLQEKVATQLIRSLNELNTKRITVVTIYQPQKGKKSRFETYLSPNFSQLSSKSMENRKTRAARRRTSYQICPLLGPQKSSGKSVGKTGRNGEPRLVKRRNQNQVRMISRKKANRPHGKLL